MPTRNQTLLDAISALSKRAGAAILADKSQTSRVSQKADLSPVTSADLAAQEVILEGLTELAPGIPVLSEESAEVPYDERSAWSEYFLVDPLDGTKEFIKGRKEYTVNIALISGGVPVLGAVYVPELGVTYAGADGLGSLRAQDGGDWELIRVAPSSRPIARVVGSSSHPSPEMTEFLRLLGDHELLSIGSSLKLCQVADGRAHVYPRFGLTSEWDTAAGHAVVLHAGGQVVTIDGSPLTYNQKDSLLNPPFFVLGPRDREWLEIAAQALGH